MPTSDLSTAEGILRELWDARADRDHLTAEAFRARQKAAWQAARRLLDLPSKDPASPKTEA